MELLSNERKILSSNNELFVLTNIRVIQSSKEIGYSDANFIFLEDISSVQSIYKSSLLALVLCIVFIAFSGLTVMQRIDETEYTLGSFCLGIIAFLYWWYTRKRIVSIHPNGGKAIEFEVEGMLAEQVGDFIDKLQEAKLKRVEELHKNAVQIGI